MVALPLHYGTLSQTDRQTSECHKGRTAPRSSTS